MRKICTKTCRIRAKYKEIQAVSLADIHQFTESKVIKRQVGWSILAYPKTLCISQVIAFPIINPSTGPTGFDQNFPYRKASKLELQMSGNGAAALPPSNPFPYLTRFRIEYFYLLLIWTHLFQPLVPISFSSQSLLSLKALNALQTPTLPTDKEEMMLWLRTNHLFHPRYSGLTAWTSPFIPPETWLSECQQLF